MRQTVIMLVLAVLLGGFWYMHDVKYKGEQAEQKTAQERVFPDCQTDDLTEIIWSDGANTADTRRVFRKRGGTWLMELSGGLTLLASSEKLDAAAAETVNLKHTSIIMEKPAPTALAQYGLDKPVQRLELKVKGQKHPLVLMLGGRTPDDSSSYAYTDAAKAVLEVSGQFMSDLNAPIDELREKGFLAISPADAESLTYDKGTKKFGDRFVLRRQRTGDDAETSAVASPQDKWTLEAGKSMAADPKKVNDYLWKLQALEFSRFLHPDEYSKIGDVTLKLRLTAKDLPNAVVLEFGQVVPGMVGTYYVRRSLEGTDFSEVGLVSVVQAEKGEKDLLAKTPYSFEDHHLLSFDVQDVQKVSVVVYGAGAKAENGQAQDAQIEARRIRDGWDIAKPNPANKNEEECGNAIAGMLYNIADLEWKHTISRDAKSAQGKALLADPQAKVVIYGAGQEILASFEVLGKALGGAAIAVEGDDKLMVVESTPQAAWLKTLKALQPVKPGSQEATSATSKKPTQAEAAEVPAVGGDARD